MNVMQEQKAINTTVSDSLNDRIRVLCNTEILRRQNLGGQSAEGVRVFGKKCVAYDTGTGLVARIIWRYRKKGKFNRNAFTLRSMFRKQREGVELWEILNGAFEHYLYIELDNMRITDWFLVNLNPFRYAVNSNREKFLAPGLEQRNEDVFGRWDGTSYFEFNVKDFPSGTVCRVKEFDRSWERAKETYIYDGNPDTKWIGGDV